MTEQQQVNYVTADRHDAMYAKLDDRISALEDENERLREELDSATETISMLSAAIGGRESGKFEKFAAIIEFADGKRSPGTEEVAVYRDEIRGATGVSAKHAYTLMEEMDEALTFADQQDRKKRENHKDIAKRVVIDFDGRSVEKLTGLVYAASGPSCQGDEQ